MALLLEKMRRVVSMSGYEKSKISNPEESNKQLPPYTGRNQKKTHRSMKNAGSTWEARTRRLCELVNELLSVHQAVVDWERSRIGKTRTKGEKRTTSMRGEEEVMSAERRRNCKPRSDQQQPKSSINQS
jgi:hypothetical protein